MPELLPPADNREAIVSMWTRLATVERDQARFEAALAQLHTDMARGHEQNENHLGEQDKVLADIRERQAKQGARWPDGAKIVLGAIVGAVLSFLSQRGRL